MLGLQCRLWPTVGLPVFVTMLGCDDGSGAPQASGTTSDGGSESASGGGEDGHACPAGSQRPPPQEIATLDFASATLGAVAADGSAVAVGGWPSEVARFSPDGSELWRAPLEAEGNSVHFGSVLVGEDVVVVGNVGSVGTLWRFGADGTPLSVEADAEGRAYAAAALAPGGGMALVADGTVERHAPDGSIAWSQDIEAPEGSSLLAAAAPTDDRVFLAGGIGGEGEALVLRVAPGEVEQTLLPPEEFPNAFFYGVAPTPQGGAVAVGRSEQDQLVAMLDGAGAVLWTSTCGPTELGGTADHVTVDGDRVVLGGMRPKPEPGCADACSGAHFVWVRELSLDGSIVSTSAPESLTGAEYPFEAVVALALDPSGSIVALADSNDGARLLRFPE